MPPVLRMHNVKRVATLLSTTLAGSVAVGQTVTPVSYVGFPTDGQGTVRIGKPNVIQTQEYVLVDFRSQPWPVLERSVNGSTIAAHDATHEVATYVTPDSLAGLVGWYADGTLVANAVDIDVQGDGLTVDVDPEDATRVRLRHTDTAASRVRSPIERLALFDRFA